MQEKKIRVAIAAWEIGRSNTGLGVKIGGLGQVLDELPRELIAAARDEGLELEIEVLSPCFAHYDKRRLVSTGQRIPVCLDNHWFDFEVFKYEFDDGLTGVYFWDEFQLHWTNSKAVYPFDPLLGLRLYSSVSQAMAGYIKSRPFDTVHSHDHHVALLPFYLGDEFLSRVPHHFTIHNATYQGNCPTEGNGYELVKSINLAGESLFHKYFDFFDHVNLMKGCMLKTHETHGKITTVSGDFGGTWGYAAELRESAEEINRRAMELNSGRVVKEAFVPNRFLDVFEKLPIVGITNGLSDRNRPENLPELKAGWLRQAEQNRDNGEGIFRNPQVFEEMLAKDHEFDTIRIKVKSELKRLLHLEAFGSEPPPELVLVTAVGRLVAQKNLGLVADVAQETLAHDPGAKFVVLASAPEGEGEGEKTKADFVELARRFGDRFYFRSDFSGPFSKLILAGGDFCLIPSRFEPCGLVDYEASLLGTLVIGRRTGGLSKVDPFAYLYDWLDIGDREGEAAAFLEQIKVALEVFRNKPETHQDMVREAMSLDASWRKSAEQYLRVYRYGMLVKQWETERYLPQYSAKEAAGRLAHEEPLFGALFSSVWGGKLDRELERALNALRLEKQ
ncbi:MAG TPA: glycogen/starch synthase [Acidobacteriota bacterium]|nr:glycogen/starch synthase [Acidobacteriota bacterium]